MTKNKAAWVIITMCMILGAFLLRDQHKTNRVIGLIQAQTVQIETVRAACIKTKQQKQAYTRMLDGLPMPSHERTTRVECTIKPWTPIYCAVSDRCYGFQMQGKIGKHLVALIYRLTEELDVMPGDREMIRDALLKLVRKGS